VKKIVKIRKPRKCPFCEGMMNVGEMAAYYEERYPKYNDDDIQIGIEYFKGWYHANIDMCEKNLLEKDII